MHGAITVCTEHSAVWNVKNRSWQIVLPEIVTELKALAVEVEADVYEGCCDSCNALASVSFAALYESRYASASYREMGQEVFLLDTSES